MNYIGVQPVNCETAWLHDPRAGRRDEIYVQGVS